MRAHNSLEKEEEEEEGGGEETRESGKTEMVWTCTKER